MKLESSLPEKPGWIFVTPGFDFVLLLLALVMLTGVVARESLVEVEVPVSEFRGKRMSDESFVIVSVRQGRKGPAFYVGNERFQEEELETAIKQAADDREATRVAVRFDQRVELSVEQRLMDVAARLKLKYYRVVKLSEENGE